LYLRVIKQKKSNFTKMTKYLECNDILSDEFYITLEKEIKDNENLFWFDTHIKEDITDSQLNSILEKMKIIPKQFIVQFVSSKKTLVFIKENNSNSYICLNDKINDFYNTEQLNEFEEKKFGFYWILFALNLGFYGCYSPTNDGIYFLKNIIFWNNQILEHLFLLAIKYNNLLVVKFLLQYCKRDDKLYQASQFKVLIQEAWKKKLYDIVLLFLKADSDFPDGFIEQTGNLELDNFTNERNKLHERIRSNANISDIENYVINTESKFFLNIQGYSARYTAITSKNFDAYVFLVEQCSIYFKHDDEKKCISNLTKNETNILYQKQKQTLKKLPNAHIYFLVSKSKKKGMPNDAQFELLMHYYYSELDKIPEISLIFQVAQYEDGLEIVFDFQSENTLEMDFINVNFNGSYTQQNNQILIAAKGEKQTVLGVLAHELTHLVMNMIFQNDCKPYITGRNEETEFKDILKSAICMIQSIDNLDNEIIKALIHYLPRFHEAELIARVPHVLATYDQNQAMDIFKIHGLKNTFDYFNNYVLKECKDFVKENHSLKQKMQITELNRESGLLTKLKQSQITFKEDKSSEYNFVDRNFILIQATNGFATLLNIFQLLTKNEEICCIYIKMKFFLRQYVKISKCLYRYPQSSFLIIECLNHTLSKEELDYASERISLLLDEVNNLKIIIICADSYLNSFSNISTTNSPDITRIQYQFGDMKCDSQTKIVNEQILFQGSRLDDNDLIQSFTDFDNENHLIKLLSGDKIIIRNKINQKQPDYYLSRNFKYSNLIKLKDANLQNRIFVLKMEQDDKLKDLIPIKSKIYNFQEFIQSNLETSFKNIPNEHGLFIILDNVEKQLLELKTHFICFHFLKIVKSKELIWINNEDDDNISDISTYLDQSTTYSEEQLIDKTKSNKAILITGKAGMGKSFVLQNLALKIEEENKNKLVFLILLSQYTNQFNEAKNLQFDQISAFDFVSLKLLNHDNYEHSLFKTLLTKGKLILLFDGFDTITPNYDDIVLSLLRNLNKNKSNQLWITTRESSKLKLQEELQIPSYEINPLTIEEQNDYLSFFLKNINSYKNILEEIRGSVKNFEQLFEIPIHLEMLIEYLKNQDILIPVAEFNLEKLYSNIVDKKCESHFKETVQSDFSKVNLINILELVKRDFKEKHQKLALLFLLSHQEFDKIFSEDERQQIIRQKNLNTEFVQNIINGQPQFIHQTFAEYFCAEYFVQNLEKTNTRDVLINKILIEDKYQVVRSFFNFKLSKMSKSNSVNFGKAINQKLKRVLDFDEKESDKNDCCHADCRHNQNINENIKNILLVAVSEHTKIHAKFLIDIIEPNIRSKLYKINYNILLKSAQSSDLEIAKYLLHSGFDADWVRNSYSYLHNAYQDEICRKNGLPKLLLDYKADPNKQDKHGQTIVHMAVKEKDVDFLKILKENNARFNLKDSCKQTAIEFYLDPDTEIDDTYNYLAQIFEKEKQENPKMIQLMFAIKQEKMEKFNMLLEKENNEIFKCEHFIHGLVTSYACRIGNIDIIKQLHKINFDFDSSALEDACKNQSIRIETIQYLVKEIRLEITFGAIENSLFTFESYDIIQYLINNGFNINLKKSGFTILLYIINFNVVRSKELNDIKYLLENKADVYICDDHVGNSLHLAAERGHTEVIKLLIDHVGETKLFEFLRLQSPVKFTYWQKTAYEIAVRCKNRESADLIEEYLKKTANIIEDQVNAKKARHN
jgi:ankyrin repeat protein